MIKNVLINYDEVKKILDEIVQEVENINAYADGINSSLVSEEYWNSKSAKVFHRHIRSELVPFIKKVTNGIQKYVSYADRSVKQYKSIDRF